MKRMTRTLLLAVCLCGAADVAFPGLAVAKPTPAKSAPAKQPTPAANSELSALEIADRVQAFYDKTKTFKARFDQTYFIRSIGSEKKSHGEVVFEKPGRMSWRYKNNGNRIVSDGTNIQVYESQNQQLYESKMGKSAYPAALAFLVGEGKLRRSFFLRKLDAAKMGFEGGWALEAKPKDATPAYRSMILYIDAATAQVRRVVLLDDQGNRNRFDFSNPEVNTEVVRGEFTFVAPAGTQTVRQ